MGLIECPECKRRVSTAAAACPGCGFPIKETIASREESEPNPISAEAPTRTEPPAVMVSDASRTENAVATVSPLRRILGRCTQRLSP